MQCAWELRCCFRLSLDFFFFFISFFLEYLLYFYDWLFGSFDNWSSERQKNQPLGHVPLFIFEKARKLSSESMKWSSPGAVGVWSTIVTAPATALTHWRCFSSAVGLLSSKKVSTLLHLASLSLHRVKNVKANRENVSYLAPNVFFNEKGPCEQWRFNLRKLAMWWIFLVIIISIMHRLSWQETASLSQLSLFADLFTGGGECDTWISSRADQK